MTNLALRVQPHFEQLCLAPRDEVAWIGLYDALWPYAFAIAYRMLNGRREVAEDACQAAFIRLHRYVNFEKFSAPDDLIRYFSTVVHNCAVESINEESERQKLFTGLPAVGEHWDGDETLEAELDLEWEADYASDAESINKADRALEVIDSLGKRDRELLTMVAQGYSLKEVAAKLGISYRNAAVQVHRLRKNIKQAFVFKKKQ